MTTHEIRLCGTAQIKGLRVARIQAKPGDSVSAGQPVLALESEALAFDIEAPVDGVVDSIGVSAGDAVSDGALLATVMLVTGAVSSSVTGGARTDLLADAKTPVRLGAESARPGAAPASQTKPSKSTAPPANASEDKQSVDVNANFPALLPWPIVDFTKFGEIERKPRTRIQKISAANLHRNWLRIPHVTNHDEADITDLENFRVQLNREQGTAVPKVTMLSFLIKAVVSALQEFPIFNASLEEDALVLKRYFHIGFAADTPAGLMVPVVREAEKKGLIQLSREVAEMAAKAREGKLAPAQMSGGCFSISSLGGIGGSYFTPIINAPEVAILGVCKSAIRPHWDGEIFIPRLFLPLSLSWDHRVLDGASAVRFLGHIAASLNDFRRIAL